MNETVATIIALVSAFGAAGAGAVTAWRRAPSDNISILTKRVDHLDREVQHLSRWQVVARGYIYRLLGTLAANGIQPPEAPEELELQ